jgi:hypothetical protein
MEHRNQWKQVSLKALEFFTENETNNNSEPIIYKKRTMQTVQKEADKRARKIQSTFTRIIITHEGKQPTKDKQNNKHKTQRVEISHSDTKKQLTLNPVTRNGKIKITIGKQLITKQKTTEVQEMEREKMELLYGM